jgi:hypothetical protein
MTPGSLATSGLLVTSLVMSACAAATPSARVVPMQSFVFGTLGDREVDQRDVCGDRRAQRLEVAPSAGSLAVGLLTLGFYTPREIRISCAPLR